jgi:hypothetical protein
MKAYCYIVLIIGFFVFYQQSPVYAIVMIGLFIGVYLFFKSRKSGRKGGVMGFFTGRNVQQDSRMDDLITLMMIQQLLKDPTQERRNRESDNTTQERNERTEKVKQEILELLDD